MASGNPFQHVQAGTLMQPSATAWNAMVDHLNRIPHDQRLPQVAGDPVPAGVVLALNESGVDLIYCTPVSIIGVGEGDGRYMRITVAGEAPYAIVLQPIATGRVGWIAVTGGPWMVPVNGTVAVGDRLLPTVGLAYCEVDDSGPLMALGTNADGRCWVVFAAGGGGNDPGYEDNTVGTTALGETADAGSWTRPGGAGPIGHTLTEVRMWRTYYNNVNLYGYWRSTVHDVLGIYSISAETRAIIDATVGY
jgi:hypothetical protein